MRKLATLLLSSLSLGAWAQTSPTFSADIAPIIYLHCTHCHRPGEIGRIPLTNYQEVSAVGGLVEYVTRINYMPPWKADPDYSHFLGQNVLSDQQKQAIADWVTAGMPRGDVAQEPTPPTYNSGSQLGTPDLVLSFSQAYTHSGSDMYRVFVLPTGLTQNRFVSAVEVRPGNSEIVHHALLSWDTSGVARQNDANAPGYGYTSFGGFGVQGADLRQFVGYVPGQRSRHFPAGTGQLLPANSDLLIQMHYGPTGVAKSDSSTVNIFFATPPVTRQVQQYVMLPQALTEPFVIPAGQVKTFHGQYTSPIAASLISVGPHMHLLGKSWEVFMVRPNGDTVPLIKIPDWDFNWQGFYNFKRFIKVDAGATIHAYATYDNTSANPNNPNNPPQQVTWGEGTTDEMFFLPFMFVPYRNGDENIVFPDDTLQLGPPLITSTGEVLVYPSSKLYPVSPNPLPNGQGIVGFSLAEAQKINLALYDSQGRLVRQLVSGGFYPAGWHSLDLNLSELAAGLYILRLQEANGQVHTEKLVRS